MKKLNHDPLKSFAPITVLGRGSHVIVAHPSLAGAHAARADRLCQKQPRRAVLCLAGHRQPAEPVDGNDQECRRHRPDAHSLQGRRPGDRRRGERAGQGRRARHGASAAAHQERQAGGAGGDRRASARRCCPTCRRWRRRPCRASRPRNGRACPRPPARRRAIIKRMHDELVRIMATPTGDRAAGSRSAWTIRPAPRPTISAR